MTLVVTVKKPGQPDEVFEITAATRILAERAVQERVHGYTGCVVQMKEKP